VQPVAGNPPISDPFTLQTFHHNAVAGHYTGLAQIQAQVDGGTSWTQLTQLTFNYQV
jgi:hypothetical protein